LIQWRKSGLTSQNDRIFISHYHDPEDGFPNLEEFETAADESDNPESTYTYSRSPSVRRQDTVGQRIDMKVQSSTGNQTINN
jgi:hypothetical protein